ncbi:MAG: hypothetical protein ACOC1G_02535 [Phycisphaeraceae bacterium]
MPPTIDLETMAMQRFHQRWREREMRAGRGSGDMRQLYSEVSAMSWLLRDLVALIREQGDTPVRDLDGTIRRVVSEHDFFQEGQTTIGSRHQEVCERMIVTLMDVLEDVRVEAQSHGEVPHAPAAAPMAG